MGIRYVWPSTRWCKNFPRQFVVEEGHLEKPLVQKLLDNAPSTILVAVCTDAAYALNNIVADILFRPRDRLGRVILAEHLEDPVVLHRGDKVMLTYNIDKKASLMNGRVCSVLEVNPNHVIVKPHGLQIYVVRAIFFRRTQVRATRTKHNGLLQSTRVTLLRTESQSASCGLCCFDAGTQCSQFCSVRFPTGEVF